VNNWHKTCSDRPDSEAGCQNGGGSRGVTLVERDAHDMVRLKLNRRLIGGINLRSNFSF
jgi:hypothetical protein